MGKDSEYLTVAQAVKLTGKHPDTIRAFIKKNKVKLMKDERGRNLIPRSALMEYYGDDMEQDGAENPTKQGNNKAHEIPVKDELTILIDTLREQLKVKDELIAQQQKQIGALAQINSEINMHLLNSGKAEEQEEEPVIVNEKPKKKHWWGKR